jgi:hypothetical protein
MRPGYPARRRQNLVAAVEAAFNNLNDEITKPNNAVNEYIFNRFLSRFAGFDGEDYDAGYIFTLNQDILIEKKYIQHNLYRVASPILPGIQFPPPARPFDSNYCTPFTTGVGQVTFDREAPPQLCGHLNYIKLHGSTKWTAPRGAVPFIIGTGKSEQIEGSDLLAWYLVASVVVVEFR